MDEQSGESEEEEVMGEGIDEQEMEELWCRNEVDEDIHRCQLSYFFIKLIYEQIKMNE